VADLSRAKLKEMERAMRESGMKQNTVQRRVSIVLSCLNWCVDEEIIAENPLQGYRCRRGEDLKLIPPTPDEVALIYTHALPHIRRALAWYLGVRPGASELFRLAWKDVDLDNRMIRVWSAKKNTDMVIRELDLVDELATPLAVWKAEDMAIGTPWVVHYRGAAINSIKTAWRTTLDNAKITRRIRPYDLRHAFATQALAEGADIKAVSEVMGHNSTAMILKHYQHVLNRQKKHALNVVPKFSITEESPSLNIVIPTSEEPQKWKN
jgi:integrase